MAVARSPQQVIEVWMDRLNAGDLDGLMDLYEDDVVFAGGAGADLLRGKAAVRSALEGLAAAGGTMSLLSSAVIPQVDVALCHDHWRLELPNGATSEGRSADVVRRQPDGSWRYAIDDPFGGAGG